MSKNKTSYQHDFKLSYGEDVSPKLARKVMRDIYKMVEYQKVLESIKKHVEIISPTGYKMSAVWNMANRELEK